MEKVSIIVPVYNVEQYLEGCVESIIHQTYTNIEIILVDDGSTDRSGVICDIYSANDERIKVIHKDNGGLSSARNCGIDVAQGKFLIFVDSDDYWIDDNCLSHLVNLAEKFNADVVRGEYISVNENGEQIKTITKNKVEFELKLLDSATFFINAIAGENFSVLFLFRKEAVGTLRFNSKLTIQEDIDFNIRFFALKHNCVYTNTVFYVYRKRANSITTFPKIHHLSDAFYICDVFEYVSQMLETSPLKTEYQKQSVLKYLRVLSTMAEEPYYSNLRMISNEIRLSSIYIKSFHRLFKYRVINSKSIFVLLPPIVYIRYMHIKVSLYKLFAKNN